MNYSYDQQGKWSVPLEKAGDSILQEISLADTDSLPLEISLGVQELELIGKRRTKSTFESLDDFVSPLLFKLYVFALNLLFGLLGLILAVYRVFFLVHHSIAGTEHKKRVVVIGGGYAGSSVAMGLEHQFEVTLIDNKTYYEFIPSRLRTISEPHHHTKIQVKYANFLHKTTIVAESVRAITPSEVIADGSRFPFDYLVICSGSRYCEPSFPSPAIEKNISYQPTSASSLNAIGQAMDMISPSFSYSPSSSFLPTRAPRSFDITTPYGNNQQHKNYIPSAIVVSARAQNFEQYSSTVEKAKRILIIGGGTVGVELAAEIIEQYEDKEVVIVHSGDHLMHRSPLRAGCYSEAYFKRKGAVLVLGDKVVGQDGTKFHTRRGLTIEADLAFMCTGNIPNSEFVRNSPFTDSINANGFLRVNSHLQMPNHPYVFVAGDIADIPEEEEKLCQTAGAHSAVVINNIKAMESRQQGNLRNYIPFQCPMLISLGKYDGMLVYRGWTLTGFIPAAMKEFVEWKEMVHYQYPRILKYKKKNYTHIV